MGFESARGARLPQDAHPVTGLATFSCPGEQQARREDQTGRVPERFEAEIDQREVGKLGENTSPVHPCKSAELRQVGLKYSL